MQPCQELCVWRELSMLMGLAAGPFCPRIQDQDPWTSLCQQCAPICLCFCTCLSLSSATSWRGLFAFIIAFMWLHAWVDSLGTCVLHFTSLKPGGANLVALKLAVSSLTTNSLCRVSQVGQTLCCPVHGWWGQVCTSSVLLWVKTSM